MEVLFRKYFFYIYGITHDTGQPYLTLRDQLYGMDDFWHISITNRNLNGLRLFYSCDNCYVTIEFYINDTKLFEINEQIANCDLGGLPKSGTIDISE